MVLYVQNRKSIEEIIHYLEFHAKLLKMYVKTKE